MFYKRCVTNTDVHESCMHPTENPTDSKNLCGIPI